MKKILIAKNEGTRSPWVKKKGKGSKGKKQRKEIKKRNGNDVHG